METWNDCVEKYHQDVTVPQYHLSYTKDGLGETLDELYFCGHVEMLKLKICKYTQQLTVYTTLGSFSTILI